MLRLVITTENRLSELEHGNGPLHLGRRPTPEPGVASHTINDPYVSSNQLLIKPLDDDQIALVNLSRHVPVELSDGRVLAIGERVDVPIPAQLIIGKTTIDVDSTAAGMTDVESMQTVAAPVRRHSELIAGRTLGDLYERGSSKSDLDAPSAETLAHWFERIVAVQRAAASSGEFYQETARAVVELVGLDSGFVLRREANGWSTIAHYANQTGQSMRFSHSILRSVVQEKRTFYRLFSSAGSAASLQGISAVVAAPVFDGAGGEVIGAVYGSRVARAGADNATIRPVEAQVVQVLATTVAAGMVRLERESELARKRVQFEQFFSPVLAAELDRDPSLLEGRDREVTILFSDIRGFSRMAERLGPRDTCRLVSDVMDCLSQRIRERDGVIVDYSGDGLLAMWNAPTDQPNHATLAVAAARDMMADLPQLSEQWHEALGQPLGLGAGINTGQALVGNTGSRLKFKYGPLGHTVNLASRVEGATKQLGVRILITDSTRQMLGSEFDTRRLATVRFAGIDHPVDVYELHAESDDPEWEARRDAYEKALSLFESAKWSDACQALQPLLVPQNGNFDSPSLSLASRAINCLKSPPEQFNPVLVLETK